jgi:transcriptional regulator with XRE-family HTH domain
MPRLDGIALPYGRTIDPHLPFVKSFFDNSCQRQDSQRYAVPNMASGKKPIVIPAFGAWLERLRKGRSRATIARLVKTAGVEMDESTLANYEAGRVLAPDPGSLWALAQIYQVAHSDLVARLVTNRNDRDLSDLAPASPAGHTLLDDDEQFCLERFRALSTSDQREILSLLEFKAQKHRGAHRNTAQSTGKRGSTLAQKPRCASRRRAS